MPARVSLSGVVLAGGHSERLGQDKARLRLWGPQGPTLLEATVARLVEVCAEVVVVSDVPHDWPALPARIVFDRYPGGGALGGIYSGLLETAHRFALAVACDMPFLNPALLRYMADLPQDYDVLIPRLRHSEKAADPQVEPLHAIYGRPCLEPMRELLMRGERRIIRFFPQVRVRYLEEAEWARFDPQGRSFRNINTPAELAEVQQMLKQ
jgi:molybdopterin-guanine dinucleotide biosynthesis protein A